MFLTRFLILSVIFLWFASFPAVGGVLWTWKDQSGTLHISKKAPPSDAQYPDSFTLEPKASSKTDATKNTLEEKYKESLWLKKVDQAKQKRRKADEALQQAQKAVETANRIKQETEAFLEPWRTKKRIKRDMLNEINGRIRAANAAIAHAEKLIEISNSAEQEAQDAEKEAQQVEKDLFEQYQRIVSK